MPVVINPKVSVILPFFNSGNTLNRAIQSIANQSYLNFECILIDNNSEDRSREIAENWTKKDTRFKLIAENRQGVVYASNAGFKIAKGEFVARMDADDVSLPDRLKLQVKFLSDNCDFGAVCSKVEYKSDIKNTEGFQRYVHWVNSVDTQGQIMLKRFVESPVVNPTAMWRRSVAEKYGMYETGNFPEDYEMWLRWMGKGVKIAKLSEKLVEWHDSPKRLTRTHSVYSDEAFFKVKTKYLVEELKYCNKNFPNVAVWGASKTSRKRAAYLKEHGIIVLFYIDIKKSRQIGIDVVYYTEIPEPGNCFILVYIKPHHLRKKIQNYLESRAYKEGRDFLLLA